MNKFSKSLFISSALALTIVGCGGGSSSSDNESVNTNYDVTVVDGYILGATVTDANGNVATEKAGSKGVYTFSQKPVNYIIAKGGTFDSGLANKVEMKVKADTKTVSPLTSFAYENSTKGAILAQALGVNSLDNDFIKSNNINLAKMAQIVYVLSANKLDDEFATALTSQDTNLSSLITTATNVVKGNSDEKDIVSFIKSVGELPQQTDVSTLETTVEKIKENAINQPTNPVENTSPKAIIANTNISVNEGDNVTLDGSQSSDSDGTIISYEWSEKGVTLSNEKIFTTNTLDIGKHTIILKVTDNDGASTSATAVVTINEINTTNKAPIANAGDDITVNEGDNVTLDGSKSSDSDGTISTYEWSENGVTLSNEKIFTTNTLGEGAHTITLMITDNAGDSASDTIVVTVNKAVLSIPTPSTPKLLKTNKVLSYYDFDDGYYKKGLDRSYTRVGDIVKDNVTGLEWQDDNATKTYKTTWQGAKEYCSTLELNGTNWRIPNTFELETIVDYGNKWPALDQNIFKNYDGEDETYWAKEEWPIKSVMGFDMSDFGMRMTYSFGNAWGSKKAEKHGVRCVRGSEYTYNKALQRFNDENVVFDPNTNLLWQDDGNVSKNGLKAKEAIGYCEALNMAGFDDWRVPNITELISIQVKNSAKGDTTKAIFKNRTSSGSYLSSTEYANFEDGGYFFIQGAGSSGYGQSLMTFNVRCVRSKF